MENDANEAVGLRASGYLVMTLAAVFPEIAAAIRRDSKRARSACSVRNRGSFVNLHGPGGRTTTERVLVGRHRVAFDRIEERLDPNNRLRFGTGTDRRSVQSK